MSEWQPIETAPREGDNRMIIGADYSRDGRGHIFRCWWQPEFGAWISGARLMTMASGYTIDGKSSKLHSPEIETPTHWTPLPEPPK